MSKFYSIPGIAKQESVSVMERDRQTDTERAVSDMQRSFRQCSDGRDAKTLEAAARVWERKIRRAAR